MDKAHLPQGLEQQQKKKNSLHLTTKSLRVRIFSTPPTKTGKPGNFHQVCKRGELEQFLFWGVGFPFCGRANSFFGLHEFQLFLFCLQSKQRLKVNKC